MTSPYFDKYDRKGAYHWDDYYGGLLRMNAYTRARYDIVCECVREANLPQDGRLLDMGCGDGALTGVLHGRFRLPIAGVDTSEKGLALARAMFTKRGLSGEFRLVGSYDTGFEDASFNVVVCSDVIEHVDDPGAMLREIHRLLVPGGRRWSSPRPSGFPRPRSIPCTFRNGLSVTSPFCAAVSSASRSG